jgi:hypothetical protein
MISLLGLIILIGLTGYLIVKEFLGDVMSEAHEVLANLTLILIGIHVTVAMNLAGLLLGIGWAYFFYQVISGALPTLIQ